MSVAFRARIFGGVTAAADLYLAIAERADEDYTLASMLAGNVVVGWSGEGTPAPYVSLFPVGGEEFRNPGDAFWVREVIRASIFARSFAEAKRIAVRWGRVFNKDMEPLLMRDASFGLIVTSGFRYVGEDTYQGRPLFHGYVEMTAITGREVS
jgi:hypothetical protein